MLLKRWTEDELVEFREMLANGVSQKDLAERFDRSVDSIKSRIAWEKITPERRLQRNEAIKCRRAKEIKSPRVVIERVTVETRPAQDVLAERDYRAGLTPRDLSAALMGDPLPGYSALERRA